MKRCNELFVTEQLTSTTDSWSLTGHFLKEAIKFGLGHIGGSPLSPAIDWLHDQLFVGTKITSSDTIQSHNKWTKHEEITSWVIDLDFTKEDKNNFEWEINRIEVMFILEKEGGKNAFQVDPYTNKDIYLLVYPHGIDRDDMYVSVLKQSLQHLPLCCYKRNILIIRCL